MNYPTQTDLPKEATTYNGWSNYETWNVALWISGDEYNYLIARESKDYLDIVDNVQGDYYYRHKNRYEG